jgi:hypothetical protein
MCTYCSPSLVLSRPTSSSIGQCVQIGNESYIAVILPLLTFKVTVSKLGRIRSTRVRENTHMSCKNPIKTSKISSSYGGEYKDTALWGKAQCSLVDVTGVSEVRTASIIRTPSCA